MCKQLKELFIIIPISTALAGLIVFLYLIDPEFEVNFFKISSIVLFALWAFFVIPSVIYSFARVKDYLDGLTFEQSFRIGYYFGRGLGVLVFMLLVFTAPITGLLWYIQTVKTIKSDK